MKTLRILAAAGLLSAAPAFATNPDDVCSTRMLAGRWMFATDVGHQALLDKFPFPSDITAIGIFRVDRQGMILDGVFDVTVEAIGFKPGIGFTGDVTVNPDCTGTLHFVTTIGTERTDSIIVLGPGRVRGMSRDFNNLWTYDMRRL
jgi:hypothetical protein